MSLSKTSQHSFPVVDYFKQQTSKISHSNGNDEAVAIVPDRDSPKHILNVLNDDCIKEVLLQLENFVDFQSAASVCKRFQNVAKIWFPYKTFCIGKYWKHELAPAVPPVSSRPFDSVPLDQLNFFFRIFGEQINTIEWTPMLPISSVSTISQYVIQGTKTTMNFTNYSDTNNDIIRAVANLCGNTLISFKIIGFIDLSMPSNFKVLERIELYYGRIIHFEPPEKLKYLKFSAHWGGNFNWLAQKFPQLEELHAEYFYDDLTRQTLTEFQRLNQQLKKLTLIPMPHTFWCLLPVSVSNLRNLNSLVLLYVSVDINSLRGLKLICLRIPSNPFSKREAESLIALNLPIEELEITLTSHDALEQISKITTLKKLSLHFSEMAEKNINRTVKALPPLDTLELFGMLTLSGIETVIRQNQSRLLILRLQWIVIGSKEYDSILPLCKYRVMVRLYIDRWTGKVHVNKDVLEVNKYWLHVQID